MIVLLRKNNIILVGLVFFLLIAIYSLNMTEETEASVVSQQAPQRTVVIDAGHGGEDPGAVSDYSGIREKDINLDIAFKVKNLLESAGYKVIMTREQDRLEYDENAKTLYQKRKQDLLRRKKIMDESGADIVVSIHLNKFYQTQYYGAQTFYPPNSPESQKLALNIQEQLKKLVDPGNKRVSLLKEEPIIILRDLKTTTVIVECGFLSNQDDEKKLQMDEYRQKIAMAIKEGIVEYFKRSS